MQVHRDIMDGRYSMPPFNGEAGMAWVAPTARVGQEARLEGPLFVDEGCVVEAGARLGPYTVLGKHCHVEPGANVSGAIAWAGSNERKHAGDAPPRAFTRLWLTQVIRRSASRASSDFASSTRIPRRRPGRLRCDAIR